MSARERGTTATFTWRRWIVAHGVLVVVTAAFVFFVPGGAPALLTVPANLLHVLGASAIVLLPVSLLSGWRKTAALQSLALAAGIGAVLGGADPFGTAQSDAGQGRLRIVSVNLGVGLAEPEDVERLVSETNAHVVLLQELTNGVAAGVDVALAARYPYRALYPGGVNGKGVLSRYPLLEQELFQLEQGRPYLRCVLDVDGERVEVFNVHFSPALGVLGLASAAGRDLRAIAESVDARGRIVIAGDFNSTWRSGTSHWLERNGWREAFRGARAVPGCTFPVFGRYFGFPLGRFLRIDQIWCGAGLRSVGAWVAPDVGSDHRPVSAALEWAN